MAKEAGISGVAPDIDSRVYESDEGFSIIWFPCVSPSVGPLMLLLDRDFLFNIPKHAGEIQVAYGLFDGVTPRTAAKAMPPCFTDPDGVTYQQCVVQEKRNFPKVVVVFFISHID